MPKLTKKVVDAAGYTGDGSSRCIIWDDQLRGFGLRVYPSGRKAFVVSYRSKGSKRLMVLGEYGVLTVDAARAKARKELIAVTDGRDPKVERAEARRRGLTVDALCDEYERRHVPRKRSGDDDKRRIKQQIRPRWGSTVAAEWDRASIARWHHQRGRKHPYDANRTLSLISRMFTLGQRWGLIDSSLSNPVTGIERHPEVSRDRYISPAEMPVLLKAINEEANLYVRAALWLYLLTGLRKSELLSARWSDVDWQDQRLRIGETKNGRPLDVPLSDTAIKLLVDLPREKGNPYILPGRKPGKHLVNIGKPWRAIRRRAGVEDVRIHDLRRTVGSWLSRGGVELNMIGTILNHRNLSTTLTYARLHIDDAREVMNARSRQLDSVLKQLPAPDVTDGSGRRDEAARLSRAFRASHAFHVVSV